MSPPRNCLHRKMCWWCPRNAASTSAAATASTDPCHRNLSCAWWVGVCLLSMRHLQEKKQKNKNRRKRAINFQVLCRAGICNRKRQQDPVLFLTRLFMHFCLQCDSHGVWNPHTRGALGYQGPEASALQGDWGESRVGNLECSKNEF